MIVGMAKRGRLTVSLDPELIEAAEAAVAAGHAPSVSAWVADAMARHSEHQQRLEALAEAIALWEEEFGEITEQDMVDAERKMSERSIVVKDGKVYPPKPRKRKPA